MTFYLLMKGDTEKDAINSTNTLGDISFNTFHTEDGFKILMNIVENKPEMLINKPVDIVTDKGEFLNVEQFLDAIEDLKVRLQK